MRPLSLGLPIAPNGIEMYHCALPLVWIQLPIAPNGIEMKYRRIIGVRAYASNRT